MSTLASTESGIEHSFRIRIERIRMLDNGLAGDVFPFYWNHVNDKNRGIVHLSRKHTNYQILNESLPVQTKVVPEYILREKDDR